MQLLAILFTVILASFKTSIIVEGAVSTVIKSGGEECYAVFAPTNLESTISGNFDCLDDDLSPDTIGVTLYDSKMTPVWRSIPKAAEGTFSIRGSGRHELCIQNGNVGQGDDYVAKTDGKNREVGFALRVIIPQRGLEGEAGPDDRVTASLLQKAEVLMEGLRTMTDHQEYMVERENRHKVVADLTYNRIVQWTFLEAVVLILISCGQVLYLKKFFEQRRYL